MGLAGWLRNLEYLGCRDSIHSSLNTMEFIQSIVLFSSFPPFPIANKQRLFPPAPNM